MKKKQENKKKMKKKACGSLRTIIIILSLPLARASFHFLSMLLDSIICP
jgi:hypothetical protein